ncbi:MAG: hypothetical protein ACHQ49_09995 [Elusimicrobiota bacterium]
MDEKPRRDWVLLPPQARPVAAALSIGIVALVLWDKVARPPEEELLHAVGEAKVYDSSHAPVAQLNLSRGSGASEARALDIAGAASKPAREGDHLVPLQEESLSAPPPPGAAAARRVARASGSPLNGEDSRPDRTQSTMTEEERSARNEQMIGELERQKKLMGIRIVDKDASPSRREATAPLKVRNPSALVMGPEATPLKRAQTAIAVGDAAAGTATPASGFGRPAPDAGLVVADAGGLSSTWVLLGLPGRPPATDFTNGRLVILKPSATKIVSVTPGPDAVTIVYRSLLPDEAFDPARDRVAPLPLSPKPVLIYDASPR